MEIKSKPTRYNGYEFRSRLEARWAVFFDAIGIKFHYEYEDFILPDGTRYLPDFYLPTFEAGCYGEVKSQFTDSEMMKCKQLCFITGRKVLLLEGVPDFKCVKYFGIYEDKVQLCLAAIIHWKGRPYLFIEPGYQNDDGYIDEEYFDCLGEELIKAVYASREAKFEFGINGLR